MKFAMLVLALVLLSGCSTLKGLPNACDVFPIPYLCSDEPEE